MLRHVRAGAPRKFSVICFLALLLVAGTGSATTFVVPDDAEMVRKSQVIVTGVIVSMETIDEGKYIETEYELVVSRVLKGEVVRNERLRLRSYGGSNGVRFTHVESAAHFKIGEHVLLFLTEHKGNWTPTDLTLGKFRFGVTNKNSAVVYRDATDIQGWDRQGKVHREKVRLEHEFLSFIEDVAAGREPRNRSEYEVDPSEVVDETPVEKEEGRKIGTDAAMPSHTYARSFYDCALTRYPARWTTTEMNAGIQFKKNVNQNLSGAGDGGVGTITNALAAWTNDCNSAVNVTYGGTTTNVHNDNGGFDNVVLFNDPNGEIAGSWAGSGTIAICFSGGGDFHTFDGRSDWVNYLSSDVVFQNGYTSSEASLNVAMTHELGHGIGLRHSDASHLQSCSGCPPACSDLACDPNTAECTTTSIMKTVVNNAFGFTLQTWDQSAAGALYPASCVVLTPPTNVLATATSGTSVSVTFTAAAGATSYNVYRSTNNSTFTKISTDGLVTASPFTDSTASANTAYMYKIRSVASAVESSDSNKDFAVTMVYTDSTITAQSTTVKAAHFTQLRTAVNAMRTLNGGQSAFVFTDSTLSSAIQVKAVHLTQLRTELNTVRTALGFSTVTFTTDPTITATVTSIKKAHVDQMRAGLQ